MDTLSILFDELKKSGQTQGNFLGFLHVLIGRTITRYGERLYGHKAALSALALFRVRLFETLLAKPATDDARGAGDLAALLLQDVDAIEDRFVRAPGNLASGTYLADAQAWDSQGRYERRTLKWVLVR